jgi:hypothetical protein
MGAMTAFDGWANFYMIVGSAAGALIGLQFVVMTLLANMRITPVDAHAGQTYTTPTVIHFAAVLLLSAVVSAPWQQMAPIAVFGGILGVTGVAYAIQIGWRLGGQTVYQAVFEDRLFHVFLPLTAYAILAISAFAVLFYPRPGSFLVGFAALLLLFCGIHNAWDLVTYHVFVRGGKQKEDEQSD